MPLREYFALEIYTLLLEMEGLDLPVEEGAKMAVGRADALLKELGR